MIFIKPAHPEMADKFPGLAEGSGNFSDPQSIQSLKFQIENGIAVALETEAGEIVCLMGVAHVSIGVGDGWFKATPLLTKNLRGVKMAVPKVISIASTVHHLHRVHTLVKKGYDTGRRFVEFLGFEYETTLKRIGPEAGDYDIFLWDRN